MSGLWHTQMGSKTDQLIFSINISRFQDYLHLVILKICENENMKVHRLC